MCAAGAAAGAAPASRGARAACAAAAPSDALARGAEAAAEGAAADYDALRRVALLLVQTVGMNAADVERARGERDAARAEVRRSAAVPSQLYLCTFTRAREEPVHTFRAVALSGRIESGLVTNRQCRRPGTQARMHAPGCQALSEA